ncbi:hypothetical protein Sjap_008173 [Stephania japonica]|uniref:Uncharacterized protein n=1 Tax=Stephania japonica TaxID=461633 RepID=A0AAP0JPE7_9MAGN
MDTGTRDLKVEFENLLMEHLRLFIRSEFWMKSMEDGNGDVERDIDEEQEEEIEFLEKSRNLYASQLGCHGSSSSS